MKVGEKSSVMFFKLALKPLHVGVQPEGAFYLPKAWCHAGSVGSCGLV